MHRHEDHLCPRCEFQLVPVYAAERGRRRIIALTCPEPYCDHMQMVAKSDARRVARGQVPEQHDQALDSRSEAHQRAAT